MTVVVHSRAAIACERVLLCEQVGGCLGYMCVYECLLHAFWSARMTRSSQPELQVQSATQRNTQVRESESCLSVEMDHILCAMIIKSRAVEQIVHSTTVIRHPIKTSLARSSSSKHCTERGRVRDLRRKQVKDDDVVNVMQNDLRGLETDNDNHRNSVTSIITS